MGRAARRAIEEYVVLVFGRETGGLPPEIHERYSDRLRDDADVVAACAVAQFVDERRHRPCTRCCVNGAAYTTT